MAPTTVTLCLSHCVTLCLSHCACHRVMKLKNCVMKSSNYNP